MTRQRLNDDQWEAVVAAYLDWDPTDPHAPTVSDLVAPCGVSKQALYNRLNRLGIPLKSGGVGRRQPVTSIDQTVTVLIEELVKARVEIAVLQAQLAERKGAST